MKGDAVAKGQGTVANLGSAVPQAGHRPSPGSASSPTSVNIAAVADLLGDLARQGRARLYEHEVYALVQRAGGIEPPRHVFWPYGAEWPAEAVAALPGGKAVLKLVSPDVVHKTEAGAVRVVSRDGGSDAIEAAARRLVAEHERAARVEGVLVVEFVEGARPGLGHELFVGIRATREFGPVIAAGLGGTDTEYLASALRPGLAVAKAVATETDVERFMSMFEATVAYEIISGRARGHVRLASDDELRRCFGAFLEVARRFCGGADASEVASSAAGGAPRQAEIGQDVLRPRIAELEVNPFAFRDGRLVPLDGRGRLGSPLRAAPRRPAVSIRALLEPRSIAVLGVSATSMSLGRVVLGNIVGQGFPSEHLYVVKEGVESVDGVRCVSSLAELPETADLLVVAAPAVQLPELIRESGKSGKVRSAILIPGGAGETAGSEGLQSAVTAAIAAVRTTAGEGPVFLGPNCLGVRSEPGRYDTFFIPRHKLPPPSAAPGRTAAPVALVSQSGAFIITRLSNLEVLNPRLAISVGNQADLTLSDFVRVLTERDDIDVIAVYAEGFATLDGADFLHAAEAARAAGKLVILYKAGRTSAGRSAAAGHTAALAGDYDVCTAAAGEAGVLVADTFKEFEQLLELAAALHRVPVRGRRIGVVTNAGYEAVGMADGVRGARYQVQMAPLPEAARERLKEMLAARRLGGLVNPSNPLDLTPMADEDAYEAAARVLLDCDEVDALAVSVVPLTPALRTTAAELTVSGSLPARLPGLVRGYRKPLVFVVDCGPLYDPLALAVRSAGIPVFRSSDQAMRSLGHYLDHRTKGSARAG